MASLVSLKNISKNFQGLARLPVPPLADTLERYRQSVRHLKRKELVEKHFESVQKFESGIGSLLHSELVQEDVAAANSNGYPFSYIEKVWDDGYLGFRGPSPINICPSLSLKRFEGVTTQAQAASKFVRGVAAWIVKARTVGIRHEQGVDAQQLAFQFATARVPGADRDSLLQGSVETSNHVAVLRNGHIYLVDIVDADGLVMDESSLASTFQHIVDVTPLDENHAPIGVLSAGSRSDWAASFAELTRDPANEVQLRRVLLSLIVVNLDAGEWTSPEEVQKAMLFGGNESENRFYDKHQVIVSKSGQVAVNFEHAFSDGMAWCTWMEDVWAHHSTAGSLSSSKTPTVEKVQFSLGKSFATRIRNAKQDLQHLTESIDVASPTLGFGKNRLKLCGVSPDAFTQMCLHSAFFKTHGKLAPTYESCSTNKFFHGRTETMRTATSEMLSLVQALQGTNEVDVIKELIKQVSASHTKLAREASAGLGVDRHLLALQKMAQRKQCSDAAEFFKEDLYSYSGTWLMSTSNISRPFLEYFSFGPVTADGYGVGYVIDDDCIRLSVTSWRSSSLTDSGEMKSAIEASGSQLLSILTKQ